jgi:hypothetical protein
MAPDPTFLDQSAQAAPPRRLRFSLRGFLAMVGVIGLLISNTIAVRELSEIRGENRRLRDELGYLNIDDPSQVHVAAARSQDELQWRWRVYVPEGKQMAVFVQGDQSDTANVATNRVPLEPGESSLDIAIAARPGGGCRFKMTTENRLRGTSGTYEASMPAEISNRLNWQSEVIQLRADQTFTFGDDGPLVLLREHFPESLLFGGTDDNQRVGLRVWIDELDATP